MPSGSVAGEHEPVPDARDTRQQLAGRDGRELAPIGRREQRDTKLWVTLQEPGDMAERAIA